MLAAIVRAAPLQRLNKCFTECGASNISGVWKAPEFFSREHCLAGLKGQAWGDAIDDYLLEVMAGHGRGLQHGAASYEPQQGNTSKMGYGCWRWPKHWSSKTKAAALKCFHHQA